MILNNLTALVPEGEHWDSTALNEGIWLTTGHVQNIETALVQNATFRQETEAVVEQLNSAIRQNETLLSEATSRQQSLETQITELNEEISRLKSSAPGFSNAPKEEDEDSVKPKNKYLTSFDRQAEIIRKK